MKKCERAVLPNVKLYLARPRRVELLTSRSVVSCSSTRLRRFSLHVYSFSFYSLVLSFYFKSHTISYWYKNRAQESVKKESYGQSIQNM